MAEKLLYNIINGPMLNFSENLQFKARLMMLVKRILCAFSGLGSKARSHLEVSIFRLIIIQEDKNRVFVNIRRQEGK